MARARHTTVNIVLQGACRAAAVSADRPARCGIWHRGLGAPNELVGADSMVGLLINTVPVRAPDATTTTVGLLEQLQHAHNHTLEHQHLALTEIHRVTGHDQLFDTLFVFENYPIDTSAPLGDDGLAITESTSREYNHYPLSVVVLPGDELGLRIEYDTEVFDPESIETLIERLERVVAAMTADPDPATVVDRCARRAMSTPGLDEIRQSCGVDPAREHVGVDSGVVRRAGGAQPGGGGGDVGEGSSWTYRELDEVSNRLAHLLSGGARAPVSVWRCCCRARRRRSWRWWRCSRQGAADAPIDPAHPRGRGSSSWLLMPRRSPRSPLLIWLIDSLGMTCSILEVDDPGIDAQPKHCLSGAGC